MNLWFLATSKRLFSSSLERKECALKLLQELETRSRDTFSNLQSKFQCLVQIADMTGIRIPNGMLDKINSFDDLKCYLVEQIEKRSKTRGNPIEELYDFKEPPPNMRIVQYRNFANGGPIVIKE